MNIHDMKLVDISGTKKKEYLQAKINELKTNSKTKNIRDLYRGINDFQKGYHPRTNILKGEEVDMVTDCHSVLARWRYHFSQLLNVHGVNDVRHTDIHTVASLVPLSLRWLLKSYKGTNHYVLIKSQQN